MKHPFQPDHRSRKNDAGKTDLGFWRSLIWTLGIGACGLGFPASLLANPSGPTVAAGQANIAGLGTAQVTIHQQTQQAIINWNQFNIGPHELTRFIQPSSSSIALNRIFDVNPSQIFGRLEANGSVILLNPNGILFGPNAQVNVNGLIASSLNLSNEQFLAGQYLFQGQIGNGLIKNEGQIQGGANGIYLLAPNVVNAGVITSPEGNVALGAGTTAYVSNRPDGHGLMVEVTAPAGEAKNLGRIFADGGHVSLAGYAVNQEGLIQANSVKETNGVIELVAQQELTLASGSRTVAKGNDSGQSSGGTIIALSDKATGTTRFEKGAVIDVSGGAQGGDGGFAEVSGSQVSLGGSFRGNAAPGYRGGKFLIDPVDWIVDDNALAAFNGSGASEIVFDASNNITVESAFDPGVNWQWTVPEGNGTLKFLAGNTIRFNDLFSGAVTIGDSNFNELFNPGDPSFAVTTPWDIVAIAKNDIIFGQVNRTGSFGGTAIDGGILMAAGGANISLEADRDISLVPLNQDGTPDVLAGRPGTISAIQGNVTLKAGRNLISPAAPNSFVFGFFTGGVRVEGKGNVSLHAAGGDWLGAKVKGENIGPGFLLTDGQATVEIPNGQIGTADQYATLIVGKIEPDVTSIPTSPGIEMNAGKSIYLGSVRDKGLMGELSQVFGSRQSTLTVDPANGIALTAQTGDIHLQPVSTGSGGDAIENIRSINPPYPSIFKAKALGGDIIVENDPKSSNKPLTFWPSSLGDITFEAQGDLLGNSGTQLVGTGKNAQGNRLITGAEGTIVGIVLGNQVFDRLQLVQLGKKESEIAFLLKEVLREEPVIATRTVRVLDSDLEAIKPEVENGNANAVADLLGKSAQVSSPGPPGSVSFMASTGNIERLFFDVPTFAFPKNILIEAGNDFRSFNMNLGVPIGAQATIKAGGDIDMTTVGSSSGINFVGEGTGRVEVKGNLDLSDSVGIQHRLTSGVSNLANQGGLLDIRVGGNLNMTKSRIVTWNGADILIHGILDPPPSDSPEFSTYFDGVGGTVNVGTNAPPSGFGGPTGILTVLGGNITIRSIGNVEVNRSRVAMFGGPSDPLEDNLLSITSKSGNINAGFGGKDELVEFVLTNQIKDDQGNVIDSEEFRFDVPGSGIFTFHPDDPFPIVFPKFDTPEITALKNEKIQHDFFGRNTAGLDAKIEALVKQREPVFDALFNDFINNTPIRAGDITLTARNDSETGSVVVPPAGIRGRRIEINSDNLDLQGGTISGLANINSASVTGQTAGSFAGSASGAVKASGDASGGTLAPLGGSTGTVTTGASSTAGSASTTAESAQQVQEDATQNAREEVQQAQARGVAQATNTGLAEAGTSLAVSRGVTIEVEVKEEKDKKQS